jgi:hypothetical protein
MSRLKLFFRTTQVFPIFPIGIVGVTGARA